MAGFEGGFTGAINDQNVREFRNQQIQQMRQQAPILALKLKQAQDTMAARAALGTILKNMNQGQIAPPPMDANEGPLPPGVGTPSVPMAPPAAAAPITPPSTPPYQALPQPPATTGPDQTGGDTELGAPPSEPMAGALAAPAAPAATAAPAAPQGRSYSLPNMIKAMKAQGVPDTQVMDMLDQLQPHMTAENQQELNTLKIHNAALQKAMDLYNKTIALGIKQQDADTRKGRAETYGEDVASKVEARAESNRIRRAKIGTQAGGGGKIVKWQYDDADPPNVIGGWTRSGKRITLDEPGIGTTRAMADIPGRNRRRDASQITSELTQVQNIALTGTPAQKARASARVTVLQDELERLTPTGGGSAAPAAQETKVLNGKTYVKKGGQWYVQ